MRWLLVAYLVLPNGTAPLPLTIPQSTELSCGKAAESPNEEPEAAAVGSAEEPRPGGDRWEA